MNQRLANLFRISFIILDLLVLNIVFIICQYVFRDSIQGFKMQYTYLWFFSNASWVAASWVTDIYDGKNIYHFERFAKQTFSAYAYFLALEMLYLFFSKNGQISRLFLVSILSSFAVSLLINRFLYLAMQQFFQSRHYIIRRVMIIGYNTRAKKLAGYLEQGLIKTEIVGFCEETENVKELSVYPILGGVKDTVQLAKEYNVTEIYSTIAPEHQSGIYRLIEEADKAVIRFRIVPDFNLFIRKPVHIEYLNEMPVLSLRKDPLDDIGSRIKKRFYDVAFSLLVIIFLLSWLVPILSLLIWINSRGPVFFIQERSGRNGKSFKCIKFRSMKVNTDSNQKQATKNDSRVTKLGSFLRKSNLDEMPQFFNVLIGDMSIVGPRPHMLKHTDDYSKLLNQYMVRHFLKPGITGWAQIHGYRGEIKNMGDINNRVEYDLWYLENWSTWLDTRIIFLTVFNMVKGEKNAY